MSDIVERLRGIYRIGINDGLGAVGAGEEPDNPDEFVRRFETPPIQHEAADEIDRLRAQNAELVAALQQIAGCEPYMVGEWVIILARAALFKMEEGNE